MQVSPIVAKSVGAPLSGGERSFVQPTPDESASVKSSVQISVPSSASTQAKVEDAGVSVKTPSTEQIDQAVAKVNDAFAQRGQNLLATIEKDKETGINVFKVTDKDTMELVRQFPAESVIAVAQAITQSLDAKGQLIHVKA